MGRKIILPSLSYLHDFSQRDCNISLLVSVSLWCMFTMLNLWGESYATSQATQKQRRILLRALEATDTRGTSQSDWSESSYECRITKIGSTVLYKLQSTTKKHSKDPQSNNKIAKVGLISMISGRKLSAQVLNMNQTVLLVGRSNKTTM